MIAALLYNKQDLRVENIPVPKIASDEILLQIRTATVCGTDVRMFNNGYKSVTPDNPLVMGHELSGIIYQVGSQVPSRFKEGMRVAVAPNMGCGQCDACVSGNTQLCGDYRAFGINMPGAFAEYAVIPTEAIHQGNVIEIPATMSFEEAALAEPLSCVYNAFQRAAITLGDDVLIIGAGPIGLMHAMMAFKGGAAKVMISDLNDERLAYAKNIHSGYITIPLARLKETVMELTGGKGVDVCITANPSPKAQVASLELMALNGRVSFFGGIPADSDLSGFNTNLIHYNQINVSGTTRQSISQFRKILKLIVDNVLPVQELITDRYPLSDIGTAFDNIKNGKGIKHAILFNEA